MIEPQNTMMPLPAESAPATVQSGEQGFGAMLAQSLGITAKVDPNAILQIMGDEANQDPDSGGLGDSEGSGPADPVVVGPPAAGQDEHVSVARYISIPVEGLRPALVTEAKTLPRPPVVDTVITDPVFDDDNAGSPPVAVGPEPVVSAPSVPRSVPVPRGDGIGIPIASDIPDPDMPAVAAPADAAPSADVAAYPAVATDTGERPEPQSGTTVAQTAQPVSPSQPAPVAPPSRPEPGPVAPVSPPVTPAGPEDPIETAPGVDPVLDPVFVAAEVVRTTGAENIVRKPTDPIEGRDLPVTPTPSLDRPQNVVAPDAAPAAPVSTTAEPRVSLIRDVPVQLRQVEVPMPATSTASTTDRPVTIEGGTTPLPSGMPSVEALQPQAAVAGDFNSPVTSMQNSALAERVLRAVELQANQPPPRTMVVDIPEIEGLRLVVSVRGGAEVHVVPSSSSAVSSGLQSFMDELQSVLANRGFHMTGDGQRRRGNRDNAEQPVPLRPQRPSFRRPQPTDNDLRI